MKILLTIFRWLVGLLFIFSGLIKANDPLGLSYKMQEFFEAWNWHGLHNYTLAFALVMNVLEVVAGIALLVGFKLKQILWLLLGLIVFFTFLTSYVLFTNKIHACGCFGDCVPLTPTQTFTKDVALLVMIIVLLLNVRKLKNYCSATIALAVVACSLVAVSAMQWYVLRYLPFIDCLPYAKGKNIIEQMKIPAAAVPDEYGITFTYKKNGVVKDYVTDSLPEDLDSTYEFVGRKEIVVKKGNGLTAKIVDFSLQSIAGADTTMAVMQQRNLLLFANSFENIAAWKNDFLQIVDSAQVKGLPVYIVTSMPEKAIELFGTKVTVLRCDATVIKTAARVNPSYVFNKNGMVVDKLSWRSKQKINYWLSSYTMIFTN